MDLQISLIGLGLIVYFVMLLGSTRFAIRKGFNAKVMFISALILPPLALIMVLLINGKKMQNEMKKILSLISSGK
jgi:hypothetical protein